jgi:serine/threonine-protein kinase
MRNKPVAAICNLGISLFFIWLTVVPSSFRESIEYRGYDAMTALLPQSETTRSIVLVDINDQAMETLGPWPWSRARIAEGIQKVAGGGARTIGLPLLLDTPQNSLAMEAMEGLAEAFRTSFGLIDDSKHKAFYQTLRDVQEQITPDRILADAIIAAGTVVMPILFDTSPGKKVLPTESIEALIEHSRLVYGEFSGIFFPHGDQVMFPLPVYLKGVRGLGHLNLSRDSDGKLRRSAPVYEFNGKRVASFALALAADYLGIPEKEVYMRPQITLSFNRHRFPLMADGTYFIRFNNNPTPFERYGFTGLISGTHPPNAFQNKLVIFNFSATGLAPRISTPLDSQMPIGELIAHALQSLLEGAPVCLLPYQRWVSFLMITLAGLFITFLLPRFSAVNRLMSSLAGIAALAGGSLFFFKFQQVWIPAVTPATVLLAGFFITALISIFPGTERNVSNGATAREVRRLQGMSFQSQGFPDAAWEKLQPLPVDEDLKIVLYDLAIDFEKRGERKKALRVYEHIEDTDAEYKDIQIRMRSLVAASARPGVMEEPADGWVEREQAVEVVAPKTAPTHLGRYELLYPIGQGSMGIVYLGQDPHINRKTAIKTYRLNEEFDPADAAEMKRKFFREAESAGKLSHPGIVTIFDAGEEGGLAYIAMEYLEGEDFRTYVAKAALLPMRNVIEYVAMIAEALGYAHQQGVVHRDIKPANIMLLKSGIVKITDFGIARIIASSKTRTGIVKGTPYYMAPEQITGKKVDGRCDIFSLGVVLFQLLTGSLPFTAANPGALMHKIVNDPHPDPKSINPKILSPLVEVINKALEKEVTKRYQDAWRMAAHLRIIGHKIDAFIEQKRASVSADGN